MSTNRKNISISRNGFTLVEMVIIAPIVILLIGGFISAIVSMTGAVIASRASSSLAINIQDALNRIDLDVKTSNSILATNSIIPLTSPQGYDNLTADFKNVSVANGTMLIISSNATTGNPLNSTSNTVYRNNQPNPCSSSVNTNTPVVINIVYFVKNNSLWRRTIMPSDYATTSCVNGALGQPWQRPSCDLAYVSGFCKTQDEKLLTWTKSGSFTVDYFTSTDPNPIAAASIAGNTDAVRLAAIKTASSIKATITATSTVAGRDVSQSGTIRSSSPLVTANPITAIAAIAGTPQVGQVLTAGALTPSGATASYQWQSSATSGGTYTNISGAMSSTYTPVSSDVGNYLEVVATGTDSYSGSVTSAAITIVATDPWIAGRAGSVLVGKYVFYRDTASTDKYVNGNAVGTPYPSWGPYGVVCPSPYCTVAGPVAETQSGYTGNSVLVADNNVNFNPSAGATPDYPARDACKALGGRLPTIAELVEMYNYKSTYGNNFQSGGYYWSSSERNSANAYSMPWSSGNITSSTKSNYLYVRCVR